MVRLKLGDVFAIPLTGELVALATCTYVFRSFKNCIACEILDRPLRNAEHLPWSDDSEVVCSLFMGKQVLTAGMWPVVGRRLVSGTPPRFRVADGVYSGDEYVGEWTGEDLPELVVFGPVAVQEELRKAFCLSQA